MSVETGSGEWIVRADGSASPDGTGDQSKGEDAAGSDTSGAEGAGRSGAERLMDMFFEQESLPPIPPRLGPEGESGEIPKTLEELQEAYLESQGKVRSLSAELAGRTHALRALQSRLSQKDPSRHEVWIAEVARRARGRHRPPPSSLRRHSILTHLSARLQELYGELEAVHGRLQEAENELSYQRQAANQAQGWISELRRRGRAPDVDAQEISALQRDLAKAEARISHLESDLHRKSDALGQALQKFEASEDGRQEALERYKNLAVQQDRIVAAFQEQTRRFKSLKGEQERLLRELERAQGGGEAREPGELEELRHQLQALELRATEGAKHGKRLREMEIALGEALRRAQDAETTRDDDRRRINALEGELERLTNERVRLASERNEARQALARSGGGTLHLELREARQRLGIAEAKAVEYQLDLAKALEQIESITRGAKSLESRLEEADEELQSLKNAEERFLELQEALAQARAEADSLKETLAEVEGGAQESMDEAREQSEEAISQLRSLERQLPQLEAELKTTHEALQAAQAKAESGSLRIRELEGELRALERGMGAAEAARDGAVTAAALAEEARRLAESALESERERRSVAEASQRSQEARLEDLSKEAEGLRQRGERLEEELQGARIAFAEAEDGRGRALRERDDAKDRLEAIQAQVSLLEDEKAKLQAELQESREESRILGVQALSLGDQLGELQEELEASRGALAKAQEGLAAEEAKLAQAHITLAAAETRAQRAVAREKEAEAKAEDSSRRATQAREEAEALADRLRGAEAHRQSLESRLAEETGARAELEILQPRLASLEGELATLGITLKDEIAAHGTTREDKGALEEALKAAHGKLKETEETLEENRETSLKLRQDLRETRKAIGELRDERDKAVSELSSLRERAQEQETEALAWASEQERLEREMDQLHQELGLARQAALSGGPMPAKAKPRAPRPNPIRSAPEPEAAPLSPPSTKAGSLAALDDDELGPSTSRYRPRKASWNEEPFAPVYLDRGIEDARDPERAFATGLSSRRSRTQGSGIRRPSRSSRGRPESGGGDEAWDALVAKGRFREVASAKGAFEEGPEEEATVVWDRPIVDLESSAPGEAPKVVIPGGAASLPQEPTLEEVEALLSQGDARGALPKARTLWRRKPDDPTRLGFYLSAGKGVPGAIMEALAELDERLPPSRADENVAWGVSQALLKAEKPGEAVPYLLARLSKAEEPISHPFLKEAVGVLSSLREGKHPAMGRAQVQSSLGSLSLSTLAMLALTLEGYELRGQGPRATRFLALPQGKVDFPGAGLKAGQAALVRAMPTLGSRITPSMFDEFETLNPIQAGFKYRLTLMLLTQSADPALEKELKRHRRKHRHAIVPLPRVELMDMIQNGEGVKTIKALIKRV